MRLTVFGPGAWWVVKVTTAVGVAALLLIHTKTLALLHITRVHFSKVNMAKQNLGITNQITGTVAQQVEPPTAVLASQLPIMLPANVAWETSGG